jgi:tubulin beta
MTAQELSAKRKVILVSIGKGGNRITTAFLEQLLKDNGVDSTGGYKGPDGEGLEIFCDRLSPDRLSPRRILVDLNRDNIEAVRQSYYGTLYNENEYVCESSSPSPYWAAGFYGEGASLVDQTLETIQRKVDETGGDCVVWVIHTLGGGCGSGVGSLLFDRLARELPEVPRVSVAVLPSKKVSKLVAEPYNAGLALDHIVSSAHQVILIDNDKLFDVCFKAHISTPSYDDLNAIISRTLATLVSPLIWPCANGLRMSVEAFHAAMSFPVGEDSTPWHELNAKHMSAAEKIVSLSGTPHVLRGQNLRVFSSLELAKASYSDATSLLTPAAGTWISKLSIMNGLEDPVNSFVKESKTVIANSTASIVPRRAAAAGVHTGVADSLSTLFFDFTTMFQTKQYLRWYTQLGAKEMDFMDAETRLGSLVSAIRGFMTAQEFLAAYAKGERDFSGANLTGADLERANLSEANLSEANLSGANLSGANLSEANLCNAKLSGANLGHANLSGADLREADLHAANLDGANLDGAMGL